MRASKQATRVLDGLNRQLTLAASELKTPASFELLPHQFPPEVFSDEESGPEDVIEEVSNDFTSYGTPYLLPVGSFILRRAKPYLSVPVSTLFLC